MSASAGSSDDVEVIPGVRAFRAGFVARRLLLKRRLVSELAQGRTRAIGIVAVAVVVAFTIAGVAFLAGHLFVVKGAPEVVRTFTAGALLGLSAALVLSSLGHAAQAFFSAKDLWFWDSTPVPPWARFADRFIETAVSAAPPTVALGCCGLVGLVAGAELGPLAMLRAVIAVFLVAAIPVALGVLLAHVGGAILPAGQLRRVSLVVLGISLTAGLVWFRRARVEKVLNPEGAAELLANARSVKELGPAELPSSLGAAFVVDGDGLGFLGLLGWSVGVVLLAFAAHRLLSRRARDLAVDESPVGLTRGSFRDNLLKLAVSLTPRELRPLVEKDLLAFIRDPAQWGQVVLLGGVGALYLVNASALREGFAQFPDVGTAVLPAMHAGLITFIAAGLAVRFGFPQVGLEGPAIWILDGSPLKPRSLLTAKVLASVPVVVVYPTLAAAVGGVVLQLGPTLWVVTTALCCAVSLGVCAFSVGRGALKPVFDAASLSELAIGPGAMSTMLLSVVFACGGSMGALVSGIAVIVGDQGHAPRLVAVAAAAIASLLPATLTLWAGRRALDRGADAFVKRREDEATREYLARADHTIVTDE